LFTEDQAIQGVARLPFDRGDARRIDLSFILSVYIAQIAVPI
jgi:hypothetical protein